MKWKIKSGVLIISLFAFGMVEAESSIKTIYYQKGQVYALTFSQLYVTSIHFEGAESIKSVHCGDSSAWEVLQSKASKNSILIKPKTPNSDTDLIVRMNNQWVLFKIKSSHQKTATPLIFVHVFLPGNRSQGKKKKAYYHPYCFQGDESLKPLWMYDDNSYTYFSWRPNNALPAIYRLSEDLKQSYITNFRIHDRIFLLPSISTRWLLKRGKQQAVLSRVSPLLDQRGCHG
jgi:type IV secretory pathway VirB9-like protein